MRNEGQSELPSGRASHAAARPRNRLASARVLTPATRPAPRWPRKRPDQANSRAGNDTLAACATRLRMPPARYLAGGGARPGRMCRPGQVKAPGGASPAASHRCSFPATGMTGRPPWNGASTLRGPAVSTPAVSTQGVSTGGVAARRARVRSGAFRLRPASRRRSTRQASSRRGTARPSTGPAPRPVTSGQLNPGLVTSTRSQPGRRLEAPSRAPRYPARPVMRGTPPWR
jgi:hypothetical protein